MALLLPQDITRLRIDFEEKFAERPTYAYVGDFVECDLVLESTDGDRWVTGAATVQLP
jgi:hypothetical protein